MHIYPIVWLDKMNEIWANKAMAGYRSYCEIKLTPQSGYTLVELAVVLVILGLVAGGIVLGQDMVRRAEVQSLLIDARGFTSAAKNFEAQYDSLPGDKFDAASHWSGVSNGNGNGRLDPPAPGVGVASEPYQFWRQLQLSGELPLNMTGTNNGAEIDWAPGVNVPASKLADVGWLVGYDLSDTNGDTFILPVNHYLLVGAVRTSPDGFLVNPMLTPGEALGLDTKVDDGEAATGNFVALFWNNGCTTPESGAPSRGNSNVRYRAEDETRQCAVAFLNAFQP